MGGIKGNDGQWNTIGHAHRVVRVDEAALGVFAQLYDEPGTPARRARLPALHAQTLSSVLAKLAAWPRQLADLGDAVYSTQMWNETNQRDDGTITRRPPVDDAFPVTPEDWVLSGPHFFLANPYNKSPRKVCTANGHYDVVDLESLPDDYLPRTNYRPMTDRGEYLRRTPRVSWLEDGATQNRPVTEFFRITSRTMISQSMERTLISALVPKGAAHIDLGFSIACRSVSKTVCVGAAFVSLPFDFYVKSTGKGHFRNDIASLLPLLDESPAVDELSSRFMALNCLTNHYAAA